ncbi:hypothetical protein ACFL6R_07760 [Gemmatimonadota bacterium]
MKRTRVLSLIPGLILLAGLTGCSQEEPATAALEALQAEYDASELGYQEQISEFLMQYLDIANEYWGTEAALKAELWVLQAVQTAEVDEGVEVPAVEEIVDAIFEEYERSLHMYLLADYGNMLLAAVAMAACLIPAWRAARVDPMVVLNRE